MKKEIRECEACGETVECEETYLGRWVCCYECLEAIYGGEIPDEEDFRSVAR